MQCNARKKLPKIKKTLWLGKSCLRWLNTSSSHFLSVSVTRSTYTKKQIQCIHRNMATCFCLNKNLAFVFNMFGLVKAFTNDLHNAKPKGSRFKYMINHSIDQTQGRERKRETCPAFWAASTAAAKNWSREPSSNVTQQQSEKEENQKEATEEEWECLLPFSAIFDDWRRLREDENSNALCF